MDKQALSQIFDQNFERIYRFFYYKTLSRTEAEDLTGETFLAFVDKAKKEMHIDEPNQYLYGIAKLVFLNFLRKKYKIRFTRLDNYPEFEDEFAESVTSPRRGPTKELILKKILPQLPEQQRIILELRLIKKYSLQEIVVTIKKNMNYVKTTQKRGIQNLKKLIAMNKKDG